MQCHIYLILFAIVSIYLFLILLSIYICPSIYLYIYLSIYLSIYLFIYLQFSPNARTSCDDVEEPLLTDEQKHNMEDFYDRLKKFQEERGLLLPPLSPSLPPSLSIYLSIYLSSFFRSPC